MEGGSVVRYRDRRRVLAVEAFVVIATSTEATSLVASRFLTAATTVLGGLLINSERRK